MDKVKILIVLTGFFPGKKYGGPPVSVDNFCSLLCSDVECFILTHNHDKGEKTPYHGIQTGWNNRGNSKVKYVSDDEYNSHTFESSVTEITPDYIYLQGLFQKCVVPCLRLARKHNIKVVLAPRGELCSGAFHKKYKKLPYIIYLRMAGLLKGVTFQSTSDEETEAIGKYLGVSKERICLLTNIPSIPQNLPVRKKKKHGIGRFVFISRIMWKKNLVKAINMLKDVHGEAVLDIYGPKEESNYWVECEKTIGELPDNVRVNYCGVLSHDEIHKALCQYDAFLFPTLSENYGHVIVEALVTGCIPIVSDQTPWTDMNAANAGWALPLTEDSAFKKAIQEVVDMDDKAIQTKRKSIENYLDRKLRLDYLKADYLKVFRYK